MAGFIKIKMVNGTLWSIYRFLHCISVGPTIGIIDTQKVLFMKMSNKKVLKTFIPYLWDKDNFKLRAFLIIALLGLLISKFTSILVPLLLKSTIDALSIDVGVQAIPIALIIAYGMARLSTQFFSDVKDGLFSYVEHNAIKNVAMNVFKHLFDLSLKFHLDRKTGGLSRAIERGTLSIERFLRFSVFIIVPTLLEIVLVACVLFAIYGWVYATIILVTLGSYLWFTLAITNWRLGFIRKMNQVSTDAASRSVDSLINYETVKYFGNEEHEYKHYEAIETDYAQAAIQSKKSLAYLNIGQSVIISTGLIALMALAAYEVSQGTLTVGDFVLVNAYLIQLYLPLGNFGFAYRETKLALVNMEEMFTLLQVQEEVKDSPNAPNLIIKEGSVSFKNVSFNYNEDRHILQNITFDIPAGETLAIVGESGAGKTTLSRLLFRFYDVTSGEILIDGENISHVTQKSLREAIGIVPQDTVLFNNSIKYNISYGNPNAPFEDIQRAAKNAKIHDFIMSLPKQYDTPVGERGLKLSGGEKQRVAIARTILKRPPIFLFDEATSALDTHTEKAIQNRLKEISKGFTTLIIAHRLSTITHAHKIIVLKDGKIAERGTHNELIARKGLYRVMWEKQQHEEAEHPKQVFLEGWIDPDK